MFLKRSFLLIVLLPASLIAFAQNSSRVFFDLNYDTDSALAPVTVRTGCMMPAEAKPYPEREGYRFGIWGGTLENNTVSGRMEIEVAGTGGEELYAGAYAGEAYNDTRNCTSDFDIDIRFSSPQPAEGFKAFIGGLQASATNVEACTARGSIRVSGESGGRQLFIGGLVGSERYGTVSGCASTVKVEVRNTGFAQVGGIVGEFNSSYGVMGAAFGVTTTLIEGCSYIGKPLFRSVKVPVFGQIAGAGEPEPLSSPWGVGMSYKIDRCTYKTR